MFNRILIANRGEIALRILRACKELGIETVCIYSQGDAGALYLRQADETICIGPGPATESYLDIPRVISAAEVADADAIHPGYGFLAENPRFAEICRSCRISFIGPPPEAIALLGNKAQARSLARELGVPVTPGSETVVTEEQEGLAIAHEIGFPVMIKAAAGGGGRGMRVARTDISFLGAFNAARAEAEVAFKDSAIYIEKYVERARHVEIQVLFDEHGNGIHLGERDCTVQRRQQKLIEEAPSPAVSPELRARMGADALKLSRAAGYTNAGTVEFLLDDDGSYYFMEMNTRIQVEHPVTEMVTGIDLVKEQIRIASGAELSLKQEELIFDGVAMECRINAEDPANNFLPSAGTIGLYFAPGGMGIRVDSHVYAGYRVPPYYDSMLAKLIVHKPTREEAIGAMKVALREFVIDGIKTTIPLHLRVLDDNNFRQGTIHTKYLEEMLAGRR